MVQEAQTITRVEFCVNAKIYPPPFDDIFWCNKKKTRDHIWRRLPCHNCKKQWSCITVCFRLSIYSIKWSVIITVIITVNQPMNELSKDKTVIHTGSLRIIKTFSVTQEESKILSKLDEFADREFKGNKSQTIIFLLKEGLERHTPSNPQPTIDRCLNLNMPVKSNNLCCVPGCIAKTSYKLILKNFQGKEETFNVCNKHRTWKHHDFRFLKSSKRLWVVTIVSCLDSWKRRIRKERDSHVHSFAVGFRCSFRADFSLHNLWFSVFSLFTFYRNGN